MNMNCLKTKSQIININTEFDIVTSEINSILFTGILKYILLFEDVIPFRYEHFKHYADLFRKYITIPDESWKTALINKQREIVIKISDEISSLIKVCL